MNPYFQSFILGIIQGLTEFLPISSSAHLILAPRYFHWADRGLAFDVALHLGTLAGVLMYFWKDIWGLTRSLLPTPSPNQSQNRRLVGYLIAATIPAGVAGLLFEHQIESAFRSPHLIAWTLIAMGAFLGLADLINRNTKTVWDMTLGTALIMGISQALALIPGVSRSGVTITTALFLGLQRPEAARFSFLMSLPVIAGAGVLKFKEIFSGNDPIVLLIGFQAAAFSGFFAIWGLMRYVQTRRYTPFVIYRWLLGAFILFNLHRFQ